MSLKKLRNLLVFDYEGFFEPTNEAGQKEKMVLQITGVKPWTDFEDKNIILGTSVEVVIFNDPAQNNNFEKLVLKVSKPNLETMLNIGDRVFPDLKTITSAVVYGQYQNQLSLKMDNIFKLREKKMISEPKYKLLILEVYKIIGAIFALFILLLVLSLLIFPVKITLSILGLILIYIALVLSPFAQNIKKYGFRNALLLFQIKTKLQIQLLDSRIFVERKFLTSDETRFVKVPKIKIELNDDLKTGKIEIENSIKYSEKLKNLDVSAALKNFISEEQYFTKDSNKLIIRIVDVEFDRILIFNSMTEFINYWKSKKDRYNIFIDKLLNIKKFNACCWKVRKWEVIFLV